ncbi:MAG: cysteine desulfurase family protein [Pseudomonadota bacterium]
MFERVGHAAYLDYAASTPLDPVVIEAMQAALADPVVTANASSTTHAAGRSAAAAIEDARARVARLVDAAPREVIFTSGATEADNLALFGTARYRRSEGRHIIGTMTEHKAVTDSLKQLAAEGFDVEWLPVDQHGIVSPADVAAAFRDDTILVTLMAVNNELGVINDVASVAALCRERGVSCHVDAAQAPGKIPLSVATIPADTVALSAHKMYGPKGIGALICRAPLAPQIEPLLFGGGQERGLRPGTPATHQVIGFGAAASRCLELASTADPVDALNARLLSGLLDVPGVTLNAAAAERVPHIVSVSVHDVHGDALLLAMEPVAVSTGAACSTISREPSAVLRAIGLPPALAESTLRFSLGRFSTVADVDAAVAQFAAAVDYVRSIGAEPQ